MENRQLDKFATFDDNHFDGKTVLITGQPVEWGWKQQRPLQARALVTKPIGSSWMSVTRTVSIEALRDAMTMLRELMFL